MKKMSKAIYTGTFDPFTNGHLDIVNRALRIFDQVIVVMAIPPAKNPLLPADVRLRMLEDLFKNEERVEVTSWNGLIVEFAKKHKITSVVRGIRTTADFETEYQMAAMNRKLFSDFDTIFFMTSEDYFYISSTLVREIFQHGGEIKEFVPKEVLKHLNDFQRDK